MKKHYLFTLILIAVAFISIPLIVIFAPRKNDTLFKNSQGLKIDMPEEIPIAKKGDTLIVLEVKKNIIYVGFAPKAKRQENITLKKSSDTEWEVSPKYYPDTIIKHTVYVNGVKCTPTTEYKNVKL